MSISADMNFMDILFDRDDPVLKFVDDRDGIKQEFEGIDPKTDITNDKLDSWNTDPDDILKDFLNEEQFNFLEKNIDDYSNSHFDLALPEWKSIDTNGIKENDFSSSRCSDSGLSSDQVSPGLPNDYDLQTSHLDDDDDEHMSSAVSTISDASANHLSANEIKQESHDMDYDPQEDEQAVLGILSEDPQTVNVHKKKMHKVLNVAPVMGSNPRSILLPVNTGNGIRTYKIVSNGNGRKTLKAIGSLANVNPMVLKTIRPLGVPLVVKNLKTGVFNKKIKNKPARITHDETDEEITVLSDSEEDKKKSQYPRLILSPEEKKLIQKEGVSLPTHYPLTKFEERELKRIRRKIRNKISAQDSRKRKKEYLDGLEDRVKQCTEENLSLVKKIKFLQSQNQSLMAQLKKLQISLARTTTKTAQPATCLMVLLLSVALVMAPNLRLTKNNESEVAEQEVSENTMTPVAGRSRSLLSKANLPDECPGTDEEEKISGEIHDALHFHSNSPYSFSDMESSNPDSYSTPSERSRKSSYRSSSSGYDSTLDFLADHDYEPPPSKRSRFNLDDEKDFNAFGKQQLKKEFIIPPVDDVWPSHKIEGGLNTKEFIIPDVDEEWVPNKSVLADRIEKLTTEVKVNISDAKGTRTVVIKVPKENK